MMHGQRIRSFIMIIPYCGSFVNTVPGSGGKGKGGTSTVPPFGIYHSHIGLPIGIGGDAEHQQDHAEIP